MVIGRPFMGAVALMPEVMSIISPSSTGKTWKTTVATVVLSELVASTAPLVRSVACACSSPW